MRQIRNCKVGHFVKYNGILCQVNCFYTTRWGKTATLIQVTEGKKRIYTPLATEKVEYIGDTATDENGNFWVLRKRDIFEEYKERRGV